MKTAGLGGELDQYYTDPKVIAALVEVIKKKVPHWNNLHWIDFSAGNNDFLRILKPVHKSAFDLDPQSPAVKRYDWLTVTKRMVKTRGRKVALAFNPPFGSKAALARRFLLHGIKEFEPEIIAVVVPYRTYTGTPAIKAAYAKITAFLLPRNSFYIVADNGEKKQFHVPVPFLLLRRRATPLKKAQTTSQYTSSLVQSMRRALTAPHKLGQYDMLVAVSGGAIGRNVFLQKASGEKPWVWYYDGKVRGRYKSPRDSPMHIHVQYMGVVFTNAVGERTKERIAKELGNHVPRTAFLRAPYSISAPMLHRMIDVVVRDKA